MCCSKRVTSATNVDKLLKCASKSICFLLMVGYSVWRSLKFSYNLLVISIYLSVTIRSMPPLYLSDLSLWYLHGIRFQYRIVIFITSPITEIFSFRLIYRMTSCTILSIPRLFRLFCTAYEFLRSNNCGVAYLSSSWSVLLRVSKLLRIFDLNCSMNLEIAMLLCWQFLSRATNLCTTLTLLTWSISISSCICLAIALNFSRT